MDIHHSDGKDIVSFLQPISRSPTSAVSYHKSDTGGCGGFPVQTGCGVSVAVESAASLPLQEAVSVTLPIHHRPTLFSVELRTSRWTDMVEWYRHVLGLRVLVRVMDDGYALFEAGDTRVAILSRDSAGEASSRWSLGFEVVDLDAAHLRLREAGTELVEPKTHPEGFRELVTADPDGNRIRLFAWPTGH